MRMVCFAATLVSGFAAFGFWWLADVVVSRRIVRGAVIFNGINFSRTRQLRSWLESFAAAATILSAALCLLGAVS